MAKTRSKGSHGCYLYAIVDAPSRPDYAFSGIGDRPVYALIDGEVAAVVSDIEEIKIRPERRHLAAHQQVLRQLMAVDTVLPMAFGTIANSSKAVSKMLKTYHASFVEQLQQMRGKVEMGLRIALDAPDIYEYLIDQSPEIMALRDDLVLRGGGSHNDKIELGQQFAQLLEETRAASFEKIEGLLAPSYSAIQANAVKGEKEIANVAFLVERDKLAEFEQKVERAADQFDDRFTFQYSGPWAPYDFVHIELDFV